MATTNNTTTAGLTSHHLYTLAEGEIILTTKRNKNTRTYYANKRTTCKVEGGTRTFNHCLESVTYDATPSKGRTTHIRDSAEGRALLESATYSTFASGVSGANGAKPLPISVTITL